MDGAFQALFGAVPVAAVDEFVVGARLDDPGFGDERAEKKTIGDTQNAYGMRMADVIAVNDVPTWITGAVRSEMEQAGFTVIDAPSADETADILLVSGEVMTVYTTAYWN